MWICCYLYVAISNSFTWTHINSYNINNYRNDNKTAEEKKTKQKPTETEKTKKKHGLQPTKTHTM